MSEGEGLVVKRESEFILGSPVQETTTNTLKYKLIQKTQEASSGKSNTFKLNLFNYASISHDIEANLRLINYCISINNSYFKLEKYLYRSNKVWLSAQPSMSTTWGDNVEKLLDNY